MLLCKRGREEAWREEKSKGGCLVLFTFVSILDSGRPIQARNLPARPSLECRLQISAELKQSTELSANFVQNTIVEDVHCYIVILSICACGA